MIPSSRVVNDMIRLFGTLTTAETTASKVCEILAAVTWSPNRPRNRAVDRRPACTYREGGRLRPNPRGRERRGRDLNPGGACTPNGFRGGRFEVRLRTGAGFRPRSGTSRCVRVRSGRYQIRYQNRPPAATCQSFATYGQRRCTTRCPSRAPVSRSGRFGGFTPGRGRSKRAVLAPTRSPPAEQVGQRDLAVTANTYSHVLTDERGINYVGLTSR